MLQRVPQMASGSPTFVIQFRDVHAKLRPWDQDNLPDKRLVKAALHA